MDLYEGGRDEGMGNHRRYHPPAPDVLVAVFGALVIALDDKGWHACILDPRTARG